MGALGLARKRGTTHPLIVAFLAAQRINQAAGGAVISPWELDELPDEWLDAALALTTDLQQIRQGTQQVEKRLAEWRAEHRKQSERGRRNG